MGFIQFDFSDKVVLVTGASSGIGRETALEFAACGAKVVVSDIDSDLGQQTTDKINEKGGEALFVSCDVSNPTEVTHLVDKTMSHFGKLNVACNNAGIEGDMSPTADCGADNFDKVINTNLRGVFLALKAEIPALIQSGGGAIVNLSSIAGLVGFPGLPAYVASKHGIAGLTKTAALENANKGLWINAVCPGPIMTPMLERLMATSPGFEESLTASVPERRIGTPKEVAQTILFLSSDQARFITGQCLAIDGGMVAQ